MGDIVKPDQAVTLEILHLILVSVEADWIQAGENAHFQHVREAAFYLIAFCGALRGEEVPMADLGGIAKHWEAGGMSSNPHLVVALLGTFKNEAGEQYHLMPLVACMSSGLEPHKWIG